MIRATLSCVPQLKRILGNHKAIFFGAKGGGCSGFEYILYPTNDISNETNETISVENIPMIVCGKSMFLLIGTEIDWKEDHMGSRFEFKNPNAQGTCGCGATFSVDYEL